MLDPYGTDPRHSRIAYAPGDPGYYAWLYERGKRYRYTYSPVSGFRSRSRSSRGRKKSEGILGLLDKPFEFVTEKGGSVISGFRERALEERAKGNVLKGFGYALAASAASFGTGVLAGVTGLVSPKAWKGTVEAVMYPKETLQAIKSDPLSWSYLAGSIVGPGRVLKGARIPRSRVVELGRVESYRAQLRTGGVVVEYPGGRVRGVGKPEPSKWAIQVEATGRAEVVGSRLGKPKVYKIERAVVRTPGGESVITEGVEFGGKWSRWYQRGRTKSQGKTVTASFDIRVEKAGRGYRYTYRGYIEDPVDVQRLRQRLKITSVTEEVLPGVKTKLEVYEPIGLGKGRYALGLVGGLASIGSSKEASIEGVREDRGQPEAESSLTLGSFAPPGGRGRARHARHGGLGLGSDGFSLRRRRGRDRWRYNEIVYEGIDPGIFWK